MNEFISTTRWTSSSERAYNQKRLSQKVSLPSFVKGVFAQAIALTALSTIAVAADNHVAGTLQRIDVVNMLWNPHSTGAAPGLSPTSVVVAFANGGAKPCFTTTLAFEGATTVLSGPGQACVAAVTSVTITPVTGPAGQVFATPSGPTNIDGSYYATQMIITDSTDPVFDSTNGAVKTAGVLSVTSQGQYK